MPTPLTLSFSFDSLPATLWHALTNVSLMRRWYFPQLQSFEPVVGFKFQFEDDGSLYQKEWIVTKVIEGKTLAHSWAYKGYPGISEVRFDLLEDRGDTTLRVTQTGLESFPDDPHFRRERFEQGWNNLLGNNLKRLLESA